MIIQGESGLTSDQYNALLAATGDPTLKVTLEQYTPKFALHDSDGCGEVIANFDAIVSGTVLVRAYQYTADQIQIDTLASEDGGDQAWATQILVATNVVSTVVISLAITGNSVRVFWYDGTNIKYHESADNGANWGAAQTTLAVSDLTLLAATSMTRVHYFAETAKGNHRLCVANSTLGVWSELASDIYWPFKPTSLDAIVGFHAEETCAGDNDVLVFSTDYPPIISAKVVGTTYTEYLVRVQGLAMIRYQNERWSEHQEFDLIDRCSEFPSRYGVRLSKYENEFGFLTYHRIDGEFAAYDHESVALSRSRDGLNWEAPYLLANTLDVATMAIHCNTFVYLLNSTTTYRSKSSGYFGDAQTTLDVTDYVSNISATAGQIQNVTIALENEANVLDALAIFSDDVNLQARVEMGYYVGGDALLVQTALVDVPSYGNTRLVPVVELELDTLDELGRLNSVTVDQSIERDSQIAGGDHFRSSDGTDYSGLRHTAGQEGAWKAPDGEQELWLITNESPGTAFNTFCSYTWNGSAQCGINLPSTTSDDYAGLVFRAYNARNLYSVRYNADRDTIELIDRKDNIELRVEETAAMTWTVDTWYWLKVVFRYNLIGVYSSTDGYTWTQQFIYEIPGVLSTAAWTWAEFVGRDIPNLDGRMGYCGTGYSTDEDYYPDPPAPSYPEPPVDPEPQDQWIFGLSLGPAGEGVGAFYTDDIESVSPSYFAMNNGLNTLGSKYIYDLKIKEWVTGVETLFAATYCGIYEYENLPAGVGEWKKRINTTFIAGVAGKPNVVTEYVTHSIEHEGLMACVYSYNPGLSMTAPGGTAGILVSEDGFKTMLRLSNLYTTIHHNYGWSCIGGSVAFAQHSDGMTLYAGTGYSPGNSGVGEAAVWRSLDRGATWTKLTSLATSHNINTSSKIWVPYHSESYDDSTIYWAVYTGTVNSGLWRSGDAGATWQHVYATSSGQIYSCAGPTYNKNIANYTEGNHLYEHNSGDITDHDHTVALCSYRKSFVMRRGDGLLISRYLIGGIRTGAGAGPIVFLHDIGLGTVTDKTGDLVAVSGTTTRPVYVIARKEYSSLEQHP